MPLKLFNSLTKTLEPFEPLLPGKVKMYVCGPTVYDEPHIGHLRSAYTFEVMRNYLAFSGYDVTFVRNVTDVDDKIIEKARETGAGDLVGEVGKVSKKYYDLYRADLDALGIRPPVEEPRATAHIRDMIRLIERLIAKGAAYASGGDVYFDVKAFPGYGKLSHQDTDLIRQNVRVDKNEKKHDELDFALWKSAKEGEPSWDSPWGKGRPGWHIECSAMSMRYLGETFDIHGGGRDLIFPHHENEIAQSEAATGKLFARYWIHHGLITVEEQKMSKSLKNYITLKQTKNIDDLKFLFLATHYSAPLDYSEEKMKMPRAVRERFVQFFADAEEAKVDTKELSVIATAQARFREAMDNDFNTPMAIGIMQELMVTARRAGILRTAADALKGFFGVFNISFAGSNPFVDFTDLPEPIRDLISKREEAKKKKEFKTADEIRKTLLLNYRIALMDTPSGPRASKA